MEVKTSWRIDLGQRILKAVTPQITEEMCEGDLEIIGVLWDFKGSEKIIHLSQ